MAQAPARSPRPFPTADMAMLRLLPGGCLRSRERPIQLRKIAGKLRENCGKMAVSYPNPPQPQGATPLRRGHTGHQQTREGDTQKAIAGNCGKLRKPAKLRKIADLNPPPPAAFTCCTHFITTEGPSLCRD